MNNESIWRKQIPVIALELPKERYAERKNWVILTWKVESLVEPKFNPGFWVIGEYLSQNDSQYRVNLTLNIESIWLSISSQFYSQYRVNLILNIDTIWIKYSPMTRNPGSNFSSPVTQLFRSKWLYFFQCSYMPSQLQGIHQMHLTRLFRRCWLQDVDWLLFDCCSDDWCIDCKILWNTSWNIVCKSWTWIRINIGYIEVCIPRVNVVFIDCKWSFADYNF